MSSSWKLKSRLKERLAREQGYSLFPAGGRSRFALVYPNSYFVGMSNLGLHVVYELLNDRSDTACERFFLPDRDEAREYQRTGTPLMSLETQTPLRDFPLIGFAVSFEMDYFHVPEILALGQVEPLAGERGEEAPLVIAGGPCATFNPEPLSTFIDAFIVGEGEVIMPAFMTAYYEGRGLSRKELIKRLAKVPGVYVPSLYRHVYAATGEIAAIEPLEGAAAKVARQWQRDFDAKVAHTVIVTEDTEFKLYLMEIARGCGRHCRFCMAGYCFRRPRNHTLPALRRAVDEAASFGKRLGLMGAAISDYPGIEELCRYIAEKKLPLTVASFRADSVTGALVEALAESGQQTLTLAPEAGSDYLRKVINKGITAAHLRNALNLGLAAGIRKYRLYIMIGLPLEGEADILAICSLAKDIYAALEMVKGSLTISINPFVPKAFTPFQWLPMGENAALESALKTIRRELKAYKRLAVIAESPKEAAVQGVLARGDRRVGEAVYLAYRRGGSKAFRGAMKELGLDAAFYLYRERSPEEIFPWEVLDMGFSRDYLYGELQKARRGLATSPCAPGCRRCGVCLE